jgi:hypothetical protein
VQTTGRSRRLADDGRHFTDRAVRFAGIVVGIVNAAPVVILGVAQYPGGLGGGLRDPCLAAGVDEWRPGAGVVGVGVAQ